MAASVRAAISRRRPAASSSIPSMALSVESQSKMTVRKRGVVMTR